LVSAITLNQEIVAVYKGGIKSLEMDLNSTVVKKIKEKTENWR
jgi:hypothetical protein